MPIHFSEEELADRRRRALAAMEAEELDALLVFRQESLYYLTGFDTFGYVYFQCLVLTPGGDGGTMTLLTRAPDLRQAQFTSVVQDIRIWTDDDGGDPVRALRGILEEKGLKGRRIGVEWHAYGLTARTGFRLQAGLDGYVALEDASDLVNRLRVVKSPTELAYVRRAGKLCDAAYDAALDRIAPGAFEGDILADMHGAIFRGGGDDPANEFIIGSGPGALMCRYFTGRRHLDAKDQITLEWAGTYRHYHAACMRTVCVGEAEPGHRSMHAAAVDALEAAKAALRPGHPIGEAFDAHARVLDAAGLEAHRMNACGYALGTTFAPNWMDWPMLYHGNPEPVAPGMVIFIHIIIYDSENGLAMTSGQTVIVGETGVEPVTNAPLDLKVM